MADATVVAEKLPGDGEDGLLIAKWGRIPGNMAIWIGILSEMTEFALMFLVYFIAKAHYPEQFYEARNRSTRWPEPSIPWFCSPADPSILSGCC